MLRIAATFRQVSKPSLPILGLPPQQSSLYPGMQRCTTGGMQR
jgi:hypothetical protein